MGSRFSARGIILVVAAVLVGLVAVPGTASATAFRLTPQTFTGTGDVISGWTWLRSTGHKAVWTFQASSLSGASSVSLNMAALVTNGVSGGSGYSATAKVVVTNGTKSQTLTIRLANPFRPVDPADSNGVGYEAYGSSSPLMSSVIAAGPTLTVTMSYPFPSSRHVAVQKSSLFLGYRK